MKTEALKRNALTIWHKCSIIYQWNILNWEKKVIIHCATSAEMLITREYCF